MVEHVKVGGVDGPSVTVVKQVFIIVLSPGEKKEPHQLQIHHSLDMPNTNIATPGIRISCNDLRRYFTVSYIRLMIRENIKSQS